MTVAEDFLLLAYDDTGRPRVDGTKLKAAPTSRTPYTFSHPLHVL
ncbi:hypothetical protein [Nocardia thraciensis]